MGSMCWKLPGKHKAELAGARVQRAVLLASGFLPQLTTSRYHPSRRLLPSPTSIPRYLSARLVNLHPGTLELGTSISPDNELVNLSRSTPGLYAD